MPARDKAVRAASASLAATRRHHPDRPELADAARRALVLAKAAEHLRELAEELAGLVRGDAA